MTARLTYIREAMDAGLDEEDAQKVFDFLLHSIAYTHRKAQSIAQAYLSYRTAFLKAHAFESYFLALLNSNFDVAEREKRYLQYLASQGIALLPPDINGPVDEYFFETSGLRAPLRSVASLEEADRAAIASERAERGDFSSLENFLERIADKISEAATLDLVAKGAFDATGLTRAELRARANKIILERMGRSPVAPGQARGAAAKAAPKAAPAAKSHEPERQMSLFDATGWDGNASRGR